MLESIMFWLPFVLAAACGVMVWWKGGTACNTASKVVTFGLYKKGCNKWVSIVSGVVCALMVLIGIKKVTP